MLPHLTMILLYDLMISHLAAKVVVEALIDAVAVVESKSLLYLSLLAPKHMISCP